MKAVVAVATMAMLSIGAVQAFAAEPIECERREGGDEIGHAPGGSGCSAPAVGLEETSTSRSTEGEPSGRQRAEEEARTGAFLEEQQKKIEPVGPWAWRRLDRAYKALGEDRFTDVVETLDEMVPNPRLNGHERALMWQTYGYAYSNLEDYEKAADVFERCLAQDALPRQATLHTRYTLAQILVFLQRHDDAIREFDEWFKHARNPSPTAFYMAAMAYMQKGDNEEALRYARQAVERASTPKESWLQLIVSLHLSEENFEAAEPVLVELIELFPKKSYWMQLAAVYAETGRHEKALTTVELVYMQGLLDQKGEYMTLAQMYLYNQIPYEAAELLKDGLDKGVLEKDAKTLQLLADSWLHARERERALVPLRQAAELSEDGNVYVRLGQILIDREDWAGAREALAAAIDKGELRHPGHARLLLGIANANEERWGEAERAFVAAREDEKTEKAANYWLQHLASRRSAAEQRAAASTDSEARPS